jgi:TP901-1 family phage major tail protein
MPAFAGPVKGRVVLLKRGTLASEVLVAGVRVKGVSINAEPIDVTNDDSGQWRELLVDAGQVAVTLSLSGVAKNHTLLTESLSTGDRTQSTVLEYPGGGKLQGEFFLASYSENGEYNGAATFEAELQSTGAVVYTPGA